MKTWFACLLLIVASVSVAAAVSTNALRPDLTGRVLTEDDAPLPGATIFIDSAGPKVGRGTL